MNEDQTELLRRPDALKLFARLIADITPGELVTAAAEAAIFRLVEIDGVAQKAATEQVLLQLGTDMPGLLVAALSSDPDYDGNEEANAHLAEVLHDLTQTFGPRPAGGLVDPDDPAEQARHHRQRERARLTRIGRGRGHRATDTPDRDQARAWRATPTESGTGQASALASRSSLGGCLAPRLIATGTRKTRPVRRSIGLVNRRRWAAQ